MADLILVGSWIAYALFVVFCLVGLGVAIVSIATSRMAKDEEAPESAHVVQGRMVWNPPTLQPPAAKGIQGRKRQ